jgi:hypothetical protein
VTSVLNKCHRVKFCALVSLMTFGAAAAPAPRQSRLEAALVRAARRGDPDALERAARTLGVRGIRRALHAPALRGAAIAAAPLMMKSWLLLPELVELLASDEQQTATRAGAAALRVAEEVRPEELQENEDLPATLRPVARRLAALAGEQRRPARVRALAVRALAQLQAIVRLDSAPLLDRLADPSDEVRRAAVELFVRLDDPQVITRLARCVASDLSAAVARRAAAALCAEVPAGRRGPAPTLDALRAAKAQDRLRQLASDADASADELLDLDRCLARGGRADRKLHERLVRRLARLGGPRRKGGVH